jgi:hypothetical protein
MGIVGIALTDEKGNEIAAVAGDTHLLDAPLASLDGEKYQCVRFIDPYGDTIFNRLQMPRLLVEWHAVDAAVTDPAARSVSQQIRGLIERGSREPHLYLRFYGD